MSYSLERCYKRKGITMTNAFPKILHEPNHKPSKIRVDKSKTKLTILFCFTIMKIKSLTAPITLLLYYYLMKSLIMLNTLFYFTLFKRISD